MRGGLLTPTCCPKKELAQGSLDAGRPEHTYLLPQKGACSHSFLLVLRPPLRLPGFKCVQPGLEALAHPPQYAGEVRVVEGNHLRAVAPPRGPRQILPLRSCQVVRGEAQPQVLVHVRALVLLGLHGVEELQELSHGALLAYRTGPDQDVFTTNQITSALVAYRSAADQDTATASSIAAALLSYYTIAQVDGLLAGKLGVTEAASALQIAVRFPDDGGADGSPQQRLQRQDPHRGSERGRLHPDPGGKLVEHRAHLQPDARQRAPLRLPLPLGTASNFVVHMSEADNVYDPLYGSFVGDQGAWSTAKMYFTVSPNGVAKLHFGAHFQAPGLPNQTAGTVDVYGLQILDATLEAGNTVEEDTAASALLLKHEFLDGGADVTLATLGEVLLEPTLTTLGNFLVRSNSQSSVASASFAVGGFQLEGYAMTLSAFAWNIVRT